MCGASLGLVGALQDVQGRGNRAKAAAARSGAAFNFRDSPTPCSVHEVTAEPSGDGVPSLHVFGIM